MRTRLIWALAVLALVVAACSPGDASGGQLDGTDWVLRSYELDGTLTIVPDNLYADAEFAAQRVRGFSGCNEFDALYRAGGRTLFVSQAAVTLRACDEETMSFEQAVLGLLNSSRTYTARRETLTIYGEGRNELLVYDAAPRNPVRGEWQVTAFNNGAGAVTSVIAGTDIDIAFGLASFLVFHVVETAIQQYEFQSRSTEVGAAEVDQAPDQCSTYESCRAGDQHPHGGVCTIRWSMPPKIESPSALRTSIRTVSPNFMKPVRASPTSTSSIPRRSAMQPEPTSRKFSFDTVPDPMIVPARSRRVRAACSMRRGKPKPMTPACGLPNHWSFQCTCTGR